MKTQPNPLRVGIGGPVGSGKTALCEALSKRMRDRYEMAVITNDIYTKEDMEILLRANALPPECRIDIQLMQIRVVKMHLAEGKARDAPLNLGDKRQALFNGRYMIAHRRDAHAQNHPRCEAHLTRASSQSPEPPPLSDNTSAPTRQS